jgi:hypothetical protein
VYGNRLEENWQGITGLTITGAPHPWPLDATGLNVHDNTVVHLTDQGAGSGGRYPDTRGAGGSALQPAANNRFERNTYHLPSTGTNFFAGTELTDAQ